MTALRDKGVEPESLQGWNLLKDHHIWHCETCHGESFVGGETHWHHPVIIEKDCFFCGKGKMRVVCPKSCIGFDVNMLPSRGLLTYLRDCHHHRDSRVKKETKRE